jgi:ParB/RepB/Spo0J family partition protein
MSFFDALVSEIWINKPHRQRQVIEVSDLISSINMHGVLQPIILKPESGPNGEPYLLIAGERRLTATRALGHETIPARLFSDLSYIEAQLIELEENVRRSDLTWQEQTITIYRLHALYVLQNEKWTQLQTAQALNMNPGSISESLRVAREMDNPKIRNALSLRTAYSMLSRVDERAAADAMSEILGATTSLVEDGPQAKVEAKPQPEEFDFADFSPEDIDGVVESYGTPSPPKPTHNPPPVPSYDRESIICANFTQWAEAYEGPQFNFLHCDFPYGIDFFSGPQSGRDRQMEYADTEQTYWTLVKTLTLNLDKLMTPSAHLMFWLAGDIDIQYKTLNHFRKFAPNWNFQTYPLVWLKSDNVGLLPDPKRGPRRVYETALIASREDRLIIQAVANAYSGPTDKSLHVSCKPEPMLKHFFRMFVDDNTRMLDPTCGSGASIRAADGMGAAFVLGLELDPDMAEKAQAALRRARLLREASKKTGA